MQKIKNSNYNFIKKVLNFVVSVSIHLLLILYPLKIMNDVVKEKPIQHTQTQPTEIEVQVIKKNNDIDFLEINDNEFDGEAQGNSSNVLSDKNRKTIEEKEQVQDYDIESDKNILSIDTVRFKYFNYYIGVKKLIDKKWKKKTVNYLSEIDNLNRNIKTNVILKVDTQGNIVSKEISKSSGSTELDKIVISVFDDVKIDSPPKELMNNKDYIYLYWDFSIDI